MLNKQLDEEKKKQAIVKEETELKIMALQQQVTFYLNENEELNNKLKNTSSPVRNQAAFIFERYSHFVKIFWRNKGVKTSLIHAS